MNHRNSLVELSEWTYIERESAGIKEGIKDNGQQLDARKDIFFAVCSASWHVTLVQARSSCNVVYNVFFGHRRLDLPLAAVYRAYEIYDHLIIFLSQFSVRSLR